VNPAAPPAGGVPTADLVIAGAAGRMGSRIVALARETPGVRVVAALEAPGHPALGRDAGETAGIGGLGVALGTDAGAALTPDRVLVEFSVPEATLEHLRLVAPAAATRRRCSSVASAPPDSRARSARRSPRSRAAPRS